MPWKETGAVNERMHFVLEVEQAEDSMAHLCRQYGISRQSGYKWWNRYQSQGLEGLQDEYRAMLSSIYTPGSVEREIGMIFASGLRFLTQTARG